MKQSLVFVLALLLSMPSYAQQIELTTSCGQAQQGEGQGEKEVVGADYVPGVDVHGKPVVSADLGRAFKGLSYPIRIPVDLDLLLTMGYDLPPEQAEAIDIDRVEVAFFELHEDGRIYYNGEDISSSVTLKCQEVEEEEAASVVPVAPRPAVTDDKKTDQKSGLEKGETLISSPESEDMFDDGKGGKVLEGQYP